MKSGRLKLVIALVAFLDLVGFRGLGSVPWASAQNGEVSIPDLKGNREKHLNKKMLVKGKLKLMGRNYFTDSRFVLADEAGNHVAISPWVPLEVPPPMPGNEEFFIKNRPRVMGDYLGRNLSVTGVMRAVPGRGEAPPGAQSRGVVLEDSIEVESVIEDQEQ